MMYPNDFGDPQLFFYWHKTDVCGFEWNVSTTIELICGTNSHVPLKMNCNFVDTLVPSIVEI